jgi:hypothetical protein
MNHWVVFGVIADNLVNMGALWKNRQLLKPSRGLRVRRPTVTAGGFALPGASDHIYTGQFCAGR